MLLFEAFDGHHSANVSTEVLPRTLDVAVQADPIAQGRNADVEPKWVVECFEVAAPADRATSPSRDIGTRAPLPGDPAAKVTGVRH